MRKMTDKSIRGISGLLLLVFAFMGMIISGCSKSSLEEPPEWEWLVSTEGNETDFARGIAVDNEGNIYITGAVSETAVFGEIQIESKWEQDAFIAKMNSNREWLWVRQVPGLESSTGSRIAVDSAGNCYITGQFRGAVDFGGKQYDAGDTDRMFVAKLSIDGDWLWVNTPNATESTRGSLIKINKEDNIVVSGSFQGKLELGDKQLDSGDAQGAFIAKLSSTGEWLDVLGIESSGSVNIFGIDFDAQGNSYITGMFSGIITQEDVKLDSQGVSDILAAKLNNRNEWVWAVSAGVTGDGMGRGITVDKSGNSYITGNFRESGSFGGHTLTVKESNDIFVAKLNSDGEWLWARRAGGTLTGQGNGIFLDQNEEHIYLGGSYSTSSSIPKMLIKQLLKINLVKVDFGHIKLPGSSRNKAFVAKLDTNGNWLWVTPTEEGENIEVFLWDCAIDKSENIYLTGGSLVDNTVITPEGVSGVSYWDIFVAKINAVGKTVN